MTSKERSGCYKCDKRAPGCHATCESYLAFAASRRREYDERRRYSIGTRTRWRKDIAEKSHKKN